jgi:cellulose synthase/poly-beta-1,6-N-acetylglucosamine synthase-like glycosyltransferase
MHWLPAILILPYVILLFKTYRSLIHLETFNPSTDPKTFISVIVACRNEQKNLPDLLKCLAFQNYPEYLFEVIVVNDWSTDKTFEIASEFNGISNILALDNKGKGKKQALRTGIKAAKGNLIITTDADCRMGKNWITTIAAFYELNRPDMIICPVQIKSVSGFFGKFQELEFMSLQGITAGSAKSEQATMCNGANLAFKREVYLNNSNNLHDEINSGDDIFLLHSLKKRNRSKILWLESPDALVTTGSSSSFMSFLKQRSRWISKGKAYCDRYTIVFGIVTFVSIVLQSSYLIACFVYPDLIWVFLAILVLKSVPDFLILLNTSQRYGKRNLMRWFLPSQLIYPFYVLTVVFYSLIHGENRNSNSPFPKEI